MASDPSSLSVIPDEHYERLTSELMLLREVISQVLRLASLQQILNGSATIIITTDSELIGTYTIASYLCSNSECPVQQCGTDPAGPNSGLTVVPKPPPAELRVRVVRMQPCRPERHVVPY
eukprot:2747301-Amphidinium_carterae.1